MGIAARISRSMLTLALAACLVGISAAPAMAAGAPRGARDKALGSVVQVIVNTRFGTVRRCSGYIYSTNGYVVTPYHVVSDAQSIQIFQADIGVYEIDRVRRLDARADIAVLGVKHFKPLDVKNTRLGESRGVKAGDPLRLLHHPAFGDQVLSDASVMDVGYARQLGDTEFTRSYAEELTLIELTGPCDVGSTGGLVCNDNYEVLGMLLAGASQPGGHGRAYAITSTYLASLLNSTFDVSIADLRTSAKTDADFFDGFFGPAPQPLDFQAPMSEGYLAWFAPLLHTQYADLEFTDEINDKIDKNWFYASEMEVDGRPLREWSASRIVIWPANVNPWSVTDSDDMYVHFDADSLFSKRIYKNRDTEERIMTRQILAMPLSPGEHGLIYQNTGANYKTTGIKRLRIDLASTQIKLLDITGLSLVSLRLLPNAAPGVGEGEPVRYEVLRRPVLEKELNFGIRMGRFPLQP